MAAEEHEEWNDGNSELSEDESEEDDFMGEFQDGPKNEEESIDKCQTLTPDEISKKMFELVNDVNSVFQLPTPYVRILLSTCKWDKEKLLERYYTGDQQALFEEAHLINPLRHMPNNNNNNPISPAQSTPTCGASVGQEYLCDICTVSYNYKEMDGLVCGHLFCKQCWDSYIRVMVMDEGRAQTIYCPSISCDIVVDEVIIRKLLSDDKVRRKYLLLITNNFVIDHPSLKWCPAPGCDNAVLVNNIDNSSVQCSCGHYFCFKCVKEPHQPIICQYLKKWLKKCDDDSETSNWIHCHTKECPKCHATIEKSGGCNHMVCRNTSCKAEFCWVCLGPWDPHGTSWYNCNRFNESDAKVARDTQQNSRAALERYLFYCNRYMNHLRSSHMESKLYEMVHEKMLELQQLGLSWVEVQFMKKAVDILCQCRKTLMYTYAFAFYLKKNNPTQLFEDNQGDLEMATEYLSEYLERELTSVALSDLKIQVQDKTKYCETRHKVLLDHVYEGYEQDIWEYRE